MHFRTLTVGFFVAVALGGPAQADYDAELEVGQWFRGRIALDGDVDVVCVPGLEGTTLTVTAIPIGSGSVSPRAKVHGASGAELTPHAVKPKKKGKGQKLVKVPISESGDVEIRVVAKGSGLGDYLLRVRERLPSQIKNTVTPGPGAIVEFPARAGVEITIALKGKGGAVPTPALLSPSGDTLDIDAFVSSNKGGKSMKIGPFPASTDGIHTLVIGGGGEGEATAVRATVRLDEIDPPSKDIVVEPAGSAEIQGTITLGAGFWLSSEGAAVGSSVDGDDPLAEVSQIVSDEVLVRLRPGADGTRVAGEVGLQILDRSGDWLRTRGLQSSSHGLAKSEAARARTRELVRRASDHEDVIRSEPNHLRMPLHVPIDPMYNKQWDLPKAGFETAWDIQPGDSARTMAVLDTGIRFDHADVGPRAISGYDFVGDAWNAGDGDGYDTNPSDPFLTVGTHGTHVAGTIAAVHGNAVGVVGGTISGAILPVRVLGVLGGTDFDIAQGILYSARITNSSGYLPLAAAEVINMSLGGPNYSAILADAVAAAVDAGVVVVAAAGNANSDKPFYPAAYPGVIAVSATDLVDKRAFYSSYGPHVTLAAPGGDHKKDKDGDGEKDGVFSTIVDPLFGPTWGIKAGTSMAAPHVAAAAFLLRSQDPTLSPRLVGAFLAAGAEDLGPTGFDPEFGHGRLDAGRSLEVLTGAVSGESDLFSYPSQPRFVGGLEAMSLAVVNRGGGGAMTVTSATSDAFWLTVTTPSGVTPCEFGLSASPQGMAPGEYFASVTLTTGEGETVVPVSMIVADDGPIGVERVHVVVIDKISDQVVATLSVDEVQANGFSLAGLPEGTYRVVAATDFDFDGIAGEEHDYTAEWSTPEGKGLALQDGAMLSGIHLIVVADNPLAGGAVQLPE